MVEFLDEKLDLVLSAPSAWGGPEALEPIILMLLMCRQRAAFGDEDELSVVHPYLRHLADTVGPGCGTLVARLPEGNRTERVVEVLRGFVEAQRRRNSGLVDDPVQG